MAVMANTIDKLQSTTHEPLLKVWVFTVDNRDIKRYTFTKAICEFTPS